MVYGITPQESPADTDRESKRRGTPTMDLQWMSDVESTWVPMAISIVKMEGRPMMGKADESPLEVVPTQEREEKQWDFIWDEVEKMKEAQENAQKEQQRLRKEQIMIEQQWAMIEAEWKQRLQEQWEKPKIPL